MNNIAYFIEHYSNGDECRIAFSWNGKHGGEFRDTNAEFRELVREAVLQNLTNAPILLVRDLFRAETLYAREAWGIADGVGCLAETLLRTGGADYLYDFLQGKFQCFDAHLGTAFQYDLQLAQTMLASAQEQLTINPDSENAELWKKGIALFTDWVAACNGRTA